MKTLVTSASCLALWVLAGTARADSQCDSTQIWDAASQQCVSAPAATAPVQPLAQPAAPPAPGADPADAARMERAHFSGKRLAVEILAGEATGIGTSLLLCNGSSCPGDGWLAFGADFVVTPFAVWGVGTAMGGRGTLLMSYLGASPALTPLTMPAQANETPADTLSRIQTEAVVSSVLLPVCSALLYEVSSQVVSAKWRMEHDPKVTVQPVAAGTRVSGGVGTVSFRF